jgi:tRNA A-37 threonylcarbamoyl transferase component Bud32
MIRFFWAPFDLNAAGSSRSSASVVWFARGLFAPGDLHGNFGRKHPPPAAGRPVAWLKYAEPAEAVQRAGRFFRKIARWLPWPVARAMAFTNGDETLRCEAHRMVEWRAAGLPAPRLLAVGEDFLITADAGPTLIRWLAAEPRISRRLRLIELAAHALGRVHGAGFCHGSPLLRHIAYDGVQLTFLHLEELPGSVMPLVTAQARDIFRFFMSAAGAFPIQHVGSCLQVLWVAYLRGRPPSRTLREIRRNFLLLHWLSRLLTPIPRRWLGRNTTRTLSVFALIINPPIVEIRRPPLRAPWQPRQLCSPAACFAPPARGCISVTSLRLSPSNPERLSRCQGPRSTRRRVK